MPPARRSASWLVWFILYGLFWCLAFVGCANRPAEIVRAQAPGGASGAGAVLTGPANSAAPTSQRAERVVAYFPPAPAVAVSSRPPSSPAASPGSALPSPAHPEAPAGISPAPPAPALPAWVVERVETNLGQHQDAAAIVKVAAAVSSWGAVKWIGALALALGVIGWLWSVGNPAGFPIVFLKIAGCGLALVLVGDSPGWLLLFLLPVGFYAAQKLGLVRVPRIS